MLILNYHNLVPSTVLNEQTNLVIYGCLYNSDSHWPIPDVGLILAY